MGIALIVVNGYCVSYSVDASFKASHSSPRLQLIAFACFMVEGRLVFFWGSIPDRVPIVVQLTTATY